MPVFGIQTKKPLNPTGFTLFEVVVVMMIISIITAIGIPTYKRLAPNIDLETASRDLASDLRHAQQLAVTEQINYRVVFHTNPDSYQIINSDSGAVIKNKIINPQIDITEITDLVDNTAVFTVTGAVQNSGQITLANNENNTTTIEIKPSGYVRISE